MKSILTIFAILTTCAIFAQKPKKMVVIPDYNVNYEDTVLERIYSNTFVLPSYTPYSRDIFVMGNFNRVNIIRPMLQLPQCTPDNNNAEYVKTTQFKPELSLSEILRKQ